MKKLMFLVIVVMQSILAGCASKSTPVIDDLQQLNKEEVELLVFGNTMTYEAVWGRWAEYYSEDYVGFGSAWSTLFNWFGWEGEEATSSFEISDTAEICWRYDGEGAWANPKLKYCGLIYSKADTYYLVSTKNPREPNIVGLPREVDIKQGDYYNLSN